MRQVRAAAAACYLILTLPAFGAVILFGVGGATVAPGGGGDLEDGDELVISGSGFGTKAGDHVFDPGDDSVVWNTMRPMSAGEPYNIQSRAVGYRGVAGPHAQSSAYYTGANLGSGADAGQTVDVQREWAVSTGGWVVLGFYHRFDPLWTIEPDIGNNYKFAAISANTADMYAEPYIYQQFTSGDLVDDSSPVEINAYDPGGMMMSPSGPHYGSDAPNPIADWAYRQIVVRTGSSGSIRVIIDGATLINQAATITGTSGMFGAGGYSGSRGTDEFQYIADLYFDAASNPNRIALVQGSFYELQPYTSWSDTSITITVRKGRLSTGEATIRLISESAGNQDLGTVTLQ